MISRINGRLAALLSGVAVLVVVLVGWYGFVSPQLSKAASIDGQIGDVQSQIASTQAYLANPGTKKYRVQLNRLEQAIPADVHMSEILRQLSWAATHAGVSITTITPSALVPSSGGQAVPISVGVQGHYFRLATFLKLLRTRVNLSGNTVRVSGRLYSVDGIQFTGGGTGPGTSGSVITATVQLVAFVSTPAPVAPAPVTTTTDTSTTG